MPSQRDSAHAALLATLNDPACRHCHLHYEWGDGSGKHATVEVATAHDGTWSAYVGLRRPNQTDPNRMDVVKQDAKHGHATAADAIAAIFDGGAPLWPAPKEKP